MFQYVEQLLQNGQYLEFYIGKSVERLFILIAKVSSLGISSSLYQSLITVNRQEVLLYLMSESCFTI